jgi:DNA-binding NtrC family response regulator
MLEGYDLLSAVTYQEGLAKYKENTPEITFLDISLPDGSGHDLLKEIRRITPDAYVIMMTASRIREDILQSMKEGAEGYIMKPFSSEMVKECIKEYYEYKSKKI